MDQEPLDEYAGADRKNETQRGDINDRMWMTTTAGVKMPRLIYGTAWKKERTAKLVVEAIRAGFRGIDTACQPKHYDEAGVGAALQQLAARGIKREELFLQTKFTPLPGQDPQRIPYDEHAPIGRQIAQSFESSRKNLQTEYVDSLVLHAPVSPHSLLMEAWGAFEKIHDQGGVRQLGISNCYETNVLKALFADARVKPVVVQNRFTRTTEYDAVLRRWSGDHGVTYQSFWTLTANGHILQGDTVRRMTRTHGRTAAQIFFRYLTQSGVVPLTGTYSRRHMREDLGIFDFELSPEELRRLDHLLNGEDHRDRS